MPVLPHEVLLGHLAGAVLAQSVLGGCGQSQLTPRGSGFGRPELSASTLEVRTWAVHRHLVPALGARRVRQLSAEDVSLFLQDLTLAGYARATLDKVRGVSVQVLRHGERQGLVVRNVAAIVPTPAGPRAQGRSLTIEQARLLLESAGGHPREAAFVLGLTRGLRPGELLGLGWGDVDLDQGVLRVSAEQSAGSAAPCSSPLRCRSHSSASTATVMCRPPDAKPSSASCWTSRICGSPSRHDAPPPACPYSSRQAPERPWSPGQQRAVRAAGAWARHDGPAR